jgi:hypothetical protein
MDLSKLDHNELLARCAWCHRRLAEDQECFGAGAKVRPEAKALLAENEGQLLPMQLSSGRQIIVMIPTAASEARAAGNDIYFQACSEECCKELTGALRVELQ